MTISETVYQALVEAQFALSEVIGEAPDKEPRYRDYYDREDDYAFDSAAWDRAETARPALEKINAALAEMEAQS